MESEPRISPDQLVYAQWGDVKINATLVFSWVIILLLVVISWLVTRKVTSGKQLSRGQNMLEVIVGYIRKEISDVSHGQADSYVPFVGTLFLFIVTSNLLSVVPGFHPPTGSLNTTTALAACVFVSVPVYGIWNKGIVAYLRNYISPTPMMLPFNIMGELSRTLALAVRLFGNIMSGTLIAGVLLSLAPLFLPVAYHLFEMLIGVIQAYIFAILAMVYIASAARAHRETEQKNQSQEGSEANG